jgi:hypothetical protein
MKTMKTMNPMKLFAELMTSKYFLWFVAILSSINILGYLSMGYIDAVVLFALTSFLTFTFSKNMTVVLLVSVIVVNLFMQSGHSLEGFSEGSKGSRGDSKTGGVSSSGVGSVSITDALTNKEDFEVGDEVETEPAETVTTTTTINKPTTIDGPADEAEEDKSDEPFESLKPATVKQHPHIDYGTTLTDAYKNLEKMLGEGGLQNLTADTKKLMAQQSKLFNSMENIAPLLSQAQDLMKNMDMTQFAGKVGGLADSAEQINKSAK